MIVKKSRLKKIKKIVFAILFLFILFSFRGFILLKDKIVAKNEFKKDVYLYNSFANYDYSFKPAIDIYSPNKEINGFFKGNVICYQDNRINPYNQYNDDTVLDIVDNKYYYYIKNVEIDKIHGILKKNDKLKIIDKKFSLYVKNKSDFINPLEVFKINYFSKIHIVNIYFLNKNNLPVSFRASYKNNYLKFAVYTYLKIYTPYYIKTYNVSNLNVFIDNKNIFSLKLDKFNKKIYSLLKTMFIKKYMIALPPIYVSNGEHLLTVEVSDFKGNKKRFSKIFFVKSE